MKCKKTQSIRAGQYIREMIEKKHPETVEQLIRLVQQKHRLSEQEIMDIAYHTGIRFTERITRSSDLKHYMATTNARWYWLIIALCMLTATVVLIIPENHPVVYLRYLLGSVLFFWMPGYGVIKSLFPGKKLEKLELIALSSGTSIFLVPIIAFVLHYTPWGIKTASVTVILLILTLALSTLAFVREYQDLPKR